MLFAHDSTIVACVADKIEVLVSGQVLMMQLEALVIQLKSKKLSAFINHTS